MSNSREDTDVSASTEDKVNAMRGYKASVLVIPLANEHLQTDMRCSTLKNPKVSDEAKQHASDVLNNELGWDNPRHELYDVRARNKEPNRVAGGLKA